MPLTAEQKNLRALLFPGKRGKLDKNDQKVFAQFCAEKGFPLTANNESGKPAARKRRRVRYRETSDEEDDMDDEDDEMELEEVAEQEQQDDDEPAGDH